MTPERTLELLQNCIDHMLIGMDINDAVKFFMELLDFTKEELIELNFNEELFNENL